jgi:hypothetical protein
MPTEVLTGAAQLETAAHRERQPKQAPKTVLLAGARGRLGETLLNDLLASGVYETVYVLSNADFEAGVKGLAPCSLAAPPRVDHLIINMSVDEHDTPASFYGRDGVYVQMDDANYAALITKIKPQLPKAAALLAPMAAFQQFSRAAALALDEKEFSLQALGISSLAIARPLATEQLPANATFMQRFMRMWFAQFRWILPNPHLSLRSSEISERVLAQLKAEQPGVTILTAADLARTMSREHT